MENLVVIAASIGSLIIANAPQLVGFVLPPVVEFINKDIPNSNTRFVLSIILCILAASLLNWNKLVAGDVNQVAISLGIIFTESQVVFKLYFQNSWLRGKISGSGGQQLG